MLDEATFRQKMPMFLDVNLFPTAQFNMYLKLGKKLLLESRWEDLLDEGLTWFVAHYLTLYARDIALMAAGGIAGKVVGNETAKSVDSVSKSIDVSGIIIQDAGHWNQTSYGIQFYQLMMMVGAGGYQL